MYRYAALPKRLALSYEDDDLQLNLQYLSCERRVWSLPSQVEKHDIADALLRYVRTYKTKYELSGYTP